MPVYAGPQPQPFTTTDYPFAGLIKHWMSKIELAMKVKQEQFQDDADEASRFFDGPYDFLYGIKQAKGSRAFFYSGGSEDGLPRPSFGMTCNKVAEMVQLFGPVLYHRNPIRQVNPRQEPMVAAEVFGNIADPNIQQQYQMVMQQVSQTRAVDKARAALMQYYLNYTPTALNLKDNSRWAIDEAIIKGMGVLWTEVYNPPGGGPKMVGSFYDTVDNLAIDCDFETIDGAKWIARRCVHPVWEVERIYGLAPGTLKGHINTNDTSYVVQNQPNSWRREQGNTNDLLVYWKIFSKMGMGQRLNGAKLEDAEFMEGFGDFVYLVITDTCDFILNLPPAMVQAGDVQSMMKATQWPTPFWADDAWPFTPIQFHRRPRKVWPMSHLKPGMGELKFINWVYSFMATKIRTACRDLIAVKKSLNEEIKNAILHGTDYSLIEIEEQHGTITEAVQFLKHPDFNGDIYKVLQAVEEQFERRVGLNELMYGGSPHQMRSASEAQLKSQQLHIRPDDMANKVEDSMSEIARKEALGIRWHLQPADVQPILGQVGTYYWQQFVYAANPSELLHQLEYRIEAGSAKKPNKDRDAQNMQSAMTSLFPFLSQIATATGQVGPVNALITDWAKSIDLDASKYIIQPPPPPPMPTGPAPAGPAPAGPPKKP